jgi:hypothetical protein
MRHRYCQARRFGRHAPITSAFDFDKERLSKREASRNRSARPNSGEDDIYSSDLLTGDLEAIAAEEHEAARPPGNGQVETAFLFWVTIRNPRFACPRTRFNGYKRAIVVNQIAEVLDRKLGDRLNSCCDGAKCWDPRASTKKIGKVMPALARSCSNKETAADCKRQLRRFIMSSRRPIAHPTRLVLQLPYCFSSAS